MSDQQVSCPRCSYCFYVKESDKKVHYLRSDNYYACNRAVGHGVRGLATCNPKLVTCKNCQRKIKK